MARSAEIVRKTREVDIKARVELDGKGEFAGSCGSAFMDHMIRTLSKHSRIDIAIDAKGDLRHHIIEDAGIAIGRAIDKALGERDGIQRFGYAYVPMDDSLARAALDLGGRAYSKVELKLSGASVEDTKAEDILHFLETFAQSLRCNLHIRVLYGTNDHHKIEAAMKAAALSLRMAVSITGTGVPSAKGEI
ncbi:MAG: imidazoleglycerol-phosphate dehydratase [Candidatus Methanomethylicia archaeon]|nr:imidazoleglycerol-phosphate dehydratase [Candidatus Methanomethylicia archaeon]